VGFLADFQMERLTQTMRSKKLTPTESWYKAIVILSAYLDAGWTPEDLRSALSYRLARPKRERKRKILPGQMNFLDRASG
jgi:hypothetical protein